MSLLGSSTLVNIHIILTNIVVSPRDVLVYPFVMGNKEAYYDS